MQVGVIADIHGNKVALDAVLRDMPPVDRLVCAGDVVGYNPWHADCVEAMRAGGDPDLSEAALAALPEGEVPTVMGNHDRAVAVESGFGFNDMAKAGVVHARETLSEDQLAWLADLPETRTLLDGHLKVVHGHPDDPDRYTYPEDFSPSMLGGEAALVTGHTHVQGHRVFDAGVVLNPGSVGQPRDGDPKAGYAVLDFEAGVVEPHRVAYDVDRVVEAVAEAGLPERIGTRLHEGR